jgi:hypothetical protein
MIAAASVINAAHKQSATRAKFRLWAIDASTSRTPDKAAIALHHGQSTDDDVPGFHSMGQPSMRGAPQMWSGCTWMSRGLDVAGTQRFDRSCIAATTSPETGRSSRIRAAWTIAPHRLATDPEPIAMI